MSSFSAKGLTNKGRSLQAKAQAGAELRYTKFVIGDGQLGGQSISALTNVISPKKTIDVTRLKPTPPNQATVGFVLSNQDVTTGFFFREIGLYAMDPDDGEVLYFYLNAGDTADYIPPTGTGDVINKNFDILVYVGQAQNVTLTVDTDLAYVTHKELEEALEGLDPDIPGASLTQPGIVQLSNATNGTRENVAPTEKALKAAYDRGSEGVTAAAAAQAKADAAETPAGAQAKADAAETNAKNASLPRAGGTIDAGALGTTAGSTQDIVAFQSRTSNATRLIVRQVRVQSGSDWTTSATDLVRKTDSVDQATLRFMGDDVLFKDASNVWTSLRDLKSSVANGKNAVASAISGKGVPASGSDDFAVLANKISQIKTGIQVATGNLAASSGARTIANLPFKPQILIVYGRADTLNNSGYQARSNGYGIAYNVNGTNKIGDSLPAFLYKDGFEIERDIETLTNVVFGANSVSFDGIQGYVPNGGTAYIVFGV